MVSPLLSLSEVLRAGLYGRGPRPAPIRRKRWHGPRPATPSQRIRDLVGAKVEGSAEAKLVSGLVYLVTVRHDLLRFAHFELTNEVRNDPAD